MTALEVPARFVVPPPAASADILMSDGAPIRLRRYGAGPVRLMLSHGNGLAINAYLPFWEPLAESFELVAFDIRNHGENPPHDPHQHPPRIRATSRRFSTPPKRAGSSQPSACSIRSRGRHAVERGRGRSAVVGARCLIRRFPPPDQAARVMAEKEQLTLRASARPVAPTPGHSPPSSSNAARSRSLTASIPVRAIDAAPVPTGDGALRPRDLELSS
jgi:hypothetical protein